jgi:SEC-C motif domain protein
MDADQTTALNQTVPCRCCSGKTYALCCQPYHIGIEAPPTPLALMQSRYCALSLGLAAYLVNTTHRDNPNAMRNLKTWKAQWQRTCEQTQCHGLTITGSHWGDHAGTVTFEADLTQFGQHVLLKETSRFMRVGKRWLYLDGDCIIESAV